MSADHTTNHVHIGELSLRVPGTSAEAGARLGRDVASGIVQQLPAGAGGHYESLHVRVEAPHGASHEELSLAIQRGILRALAREEE